MNNIVEQIGRLIWEREPDEIVSALNEHISNMTVDEIRKDIAHIHKSIDEAIDSGELQAVEWTTTHKFTNDAYCRDFFVPAGTLIVGKIHHYEHFLFALKGDIIVMSEDGAELVSAPKIFTSKVGIQRIGFALTDTWWAGVFPTEERDIDKLEDGLFSINYEQYLSREGIVNVPPTHD